MCFIITWTGKKEKIKSQFMIIEEDFSKYTTFFNQLGGTSMLWEAKDILSDINTRIKMDSNQTESYKAPCFECVVFAACKTRENERCKHMIDDMFGAAVFEIPLRERCESLRDYLETANGKQINQVRDLFDMEIY